MCCTLYHFYSRDIWFSITSFTQISWDHKNCDTITSNIRILLYTRFRGGRYEEEVQWVQHNSLFPRLTKFTHQLAYFSHILLLAQKWVISASAKNKLGVKLWVQLWHFLNETLKPVLLKLHQVHNLEVSHSFGFNNFQVKLSNKYVGLTLCHF